MKIEKALFAGAAGTAAMTMMMLMAPTMGMPEMAIGEMIGSFMGIGAALGWAMHVVIGLLLAVIYASFIAGKIPGPAVVGGMVFGLGVFMVQQVAVMPMMGLGVFSGGEMMMIGGSMMGHLIYGGILGGVYGAPAVAGAGNSNPVSAT